MSELEKMAAVKEKSQIIGEFLDWLINERKQPITLAEWDDNALKFFPSHLSIEKLLAEFFKIDLNKIEEEKREILRQLRNAIKGA